MKNRVFRQIRSRLKSLKVPTLIIVAGILLISILSWEARHGALEQLRQQFIIDAAWRASIIHDALERHLVDLEGLQSFYNASTFVTRKAFATFVAPILKTRPGIKAFEWIPRVAYPERARFEAEARGGGLQDYQIYQLDSKGNKVNAWPRQYYYPVYYVEPLAGNEPAVGFDLGSNTARLAALEQAADTGQPVATERLKLVQETGTQAGFLIFIPVYRKEMPLTTIEQRRLALQGFVLGVLRAGDAIEAAVRPSLEKGLLTELFDLYGPLNAQPLYRFEKDQLPPKVVNWKTLLAPSVTLHYENLFKYAGRQWMVEIIASPAYVQEHISLSYCLIPPIGLLLTLLLGLYLGALRSHKERAEALAKERTASLTETTNMLQLIIESTPVRVFWKDCDLLYLGCNTLFARDAGLNHPQQLLGKDDFALSWRDQADLYRADDRQVIESRRPKLNIIESQTTPAGAEIWLNTSKVPLQKPNGEVFGVLGVYEDITEYKRAEQALRQTTQKLQTVINASPLAIFVLDLEGRVQLWNPAAAHIFGWQEMEVMGQPLPIIPGDKQQEFRSGFQRALEGKLLAGIELSRRKKDGSPIEISLYTAPLYGDQGQVTGVTSLVADVTERQRAEEEIRKAHDALENVFASSVDALGTADRHGHIIQWNKAAEELFGYSFEELGGKLSFELYADPGELQVMLTKLRRRGYLRNYEISMRKKDGSVFPCSLSIRMLRDHDNLVTGSITVARDLSDIKLVEAERQRFSKMEAIGTLAGGIAHDFNNILTAIIGNISLAMLDLEMKGQAWERLVEAERACQQAQNLSRQLLTFSKGGAPIKKVVSVKEIAAESASFACRGSQVNYQTSLPDDLWAVEVDPGQISQVFHNLAINAIQAMPGGGLVRILGENLVVKEGNKLALDAGKYVKISIQDEGIGISADHLSKIFDPYFTTKQKGSGLGLATAYSIIKNHHGHIAVESKIEQGTTFDVYLPASDQKLSQQQEEVVGLTSGKGKILIMDDDPMVRNVLGKMLLTLGYEVQLAEDGMKAIEFYTRAQDSGNLFATVILDLTVPGGMEGKEVMDRLMKIDPQVKAIVSSGYSDDPVMANFQEYGFSDVIAKPYKISELDKVLKKTLIEPNKELNDL
jgi:PAS domain S-box-containing protein